MNLPVIAASALLAGGLVPMDLPRPDRDSCELVSVTVEREPSTLADPDPAITSLRLVVYCGQSVPTESGNLRNDPALKVLDLDVDNAELIVAAAEDLTEGGE